MTVDIVNRWLTLARNVGILVGIAVLIIEINQNTQAMSTASRDELGRKQMKKMTFKIYVSLVVC